MPNIDIDYGDLLCGDTIPVRGVGHCRSPKLKEMNPTTGIGWFQYSMYIYYMKGDKNNLAKLFRSLGISELAEMILKCESLYGFIISMPPLRDAYAESFNFFFTETIKFSEEYNCFLSYDGEEAIGYINDENFDDVRLIVLLMNYISQEKVDIATDKSDDLAAQRWELVQKYLNEQKSTKDEDETSTIGNMISKLCVISNSYNLTNIYELTVFQLYDQFLQACYMRGIQFSEAIVSNHGSKDFKYEDWLTPVKNY